MNWKSNLVLKVHEIKLCPSGKYISAIESLTCQFTVTGGAVYSDKYELKSMGTNSTMMGTAVSEHSLYTRDGPFWIPFRDDKSKYNNLERIGFILNKSGFEMTPPIETSSLNLYECYEAWYPIEILSDQLLIEEKDKLVAVIRVSFKSDVGSDEWERPFRSVPRNIAKLVFTNRRKPIELNRLLMYPQSDKLTELIMVRKDNEAYLEQYRQDVANNILLKQVVCGKDIIIFLENTNSLKGSRVYALGEEEVIRNYGLPIIAASGNLIKEIDLSSFITESTESVIEFIAVGHYSVFFVTAMDRVFACGLNANFHLGIQIDTSEYQPYRIYQPQLVSIFSEVNLKRAKSKETQNTISIASNKLNTLFLDKEGRAYSCGRGPQGQLGLGSVTVTVKPLQIDIGADVVHVASSTYHSAFLTVYGDVFVSGYVCNTNCKYVGPNVFDDIDVYDSTGWRVFNTPTRVIFPECEIFPRFYNRPEDVYAGRGYTAVRYRSGELKVAGLINDLQFDSSYTGVSHAVDLDDSLVIVQGHGYRAQQIYYLGKATISDLETSFFKQFNYKRLSKAASLEKGKRLRTRIADLSRTEGIDPLDVCAGICAQSNFSIIGISSRMVAPVDTQKSIIETFDLLMGFDPLPETLQHLAFDPTSEGDMDSTFELIRKVREHDANPFVEKIEAALLFKMKQKAPQSPQIKKLQNSLANSGDSSNAEGEFIVFANYFIHELISRVDKPMEPPTPTSTRKSITNFLQSPRSPRATKIQRVRYETPHVRFLPVSFPTAYLCRSNQNHVKKTLNEWMHGSGFTSWSEKYISALRSHFVELDARP